MKKGDKFVGVESGLCLEIRDTKNGVFEIQVERRTVDKKTGEIVIERRERSVTPELMRFVLAGYRKA